MGLWELRMEDTRVGYSCLQHGEDLQRLLDLLETVPASEREAYLESVCSDSELRREVLALLNAEADADIYLDQLSGDLSLPRPLSFDLTGKRIGSYRLLRKIGRGGMGVVYEAERVDGAFDQRVALKLLTLALAGAEGRKRFTAERQILAGLEHPAIARIVDGGVAEDETPWFAMEYVDGLPIDEFCDANRLSIPERLDLFLQVCDAVEHAHRCLVVHRDLKPANVLVTQIHRADSEGGGILESSAPVWKSDGPRPHVVWQVKLLDFGIAKFLDRQVVEGAPVTRTELRLMTPEYASPEQMRGGVVTTASDVYQLGGLLYELLTGQRPYELAQCGPAERERIICEQPPTRPSTALSRAGHSSSRSTARSLDEICALRRSSPIRLKRRLSGDIEKIVLKALHKEPERRYGSADRLAQDIRRHLQGLPVTARPDRWLYRTRKFLQRHAVASVATATVLVITILATTFYTKRIQSERMRAELERDRAQAEAVKAEQMSQFLTGLFRSADPRDGTAAELTARQLLDRGVEQIDRNLATQPQIQADMLQTLGRTYLELGLHDSTEQLLIRALKLRERFQEPDHPDRARTLGDIGLLRYQQAKYSQAQEALLSAVALFERSSDDAAADLAATLQTLGRTYRERGEYSSAHAALERALQIQTDVSGAASHEVAGILNSLGLLLVEIGRPEEAEVLYEQSLEIHKNPHTEDRLGLGRTLNELANVRVYLGKLKGTEEMFRRSLAILQDAYGPDHAWVGRSFNNLGNLLIELGRPGEAVEVLNSALTVQSGALGPDHPEIAYPLASLGDAHYKQGDLHESLAFYQRSVAVRAKGVREKQFDSLLAHGLVRVGRIEQLVGNDAEAGRAMERALRVWEHSTAETDPRLAPTALELGRWLVDQNRCSEALSMLRRVLQVDRKRQAQQNAVEVHNLKQRCAESSATFVPAN
jgi:serine/threonine protein kinase/tetratricopeptide (TPR) repeat protein